MEISTKLTLNKALIFAVGAFLTISTTLNAQIKNTKYVFKDIKKIDATPAKNQGHSGTCWSFSTSSFIESELIRMGKGKYDLSEMFVARKSYEEKAKRYVQMHGALSWGQGGEFHDVMRIFKEYGAMPKSDYPGNYDDGKYRLNEMEAVLKGMLDAIVRNPDGKLSPFWMDAVNGVLDAYMGKVPENFNYNGKTYTAKSFAILLGINPDDYVELTSVTNHPLYTQFVNEIPDNWHSDLISNVSFNDMREIINASLNNGYTVAWAADVSEPGFAYRKGVAVLPDVDWDTIAKEKRDSFIDNPMKQMVVTDKIRQQGLDNYTTQDDHGMQITGIAEDQLGDRFYIVKNSWGRKLNNFDGYFYASEAYVMAKTTGLMVNKRAIPRSILTKMGI